MFCEYVIVGLSMIMITTSVLLFKDGDPLSVYELDLDDNKK